MTRFFPRNKALSFQASSMLVAAALAAAATGGLASLASAGTVIYMDPRGTYLHTGAGDPSLPAVPVELSSIGVVAGDRLLLRQLGEFDNGPGTDSFTGMLAVFSASSALLGPTELNRVVDAIDAGVDANSGTTCPGLEPTDVSQDFAVSRPGLAIVEVCVIVPQGATHIFFSPSDCYFGDNSDADNDWGVEIQIERGCVPDITASGAVDGADLGVLLSSWGTVSIVGDGGDLNCDGTVDGADLGILLASWGPCQR